MTTVGEYEILSYLPLELEKAVFSFLRIGQAVDQFLHF